MKNKQTQFISISDYNYPLPDDKIAKYPLRERDQSKLLHFAKDEIETKCFYELPNLIPQNSLMIFNNTRVIHARLLFKKKTGATIEIFCLAPSLPANYVQSFAQNKSTTWHCMVGNARRWKDEALSLELDGDNGMVLLSAQKVVSDSEDYQIEFSWNNPAYSFSEILELAGSLPIPPYLNRETEKEDENNYQTVYAHVEGSVAAPTAGLHFTNKVLQSIQKRNINRAEVTLHVGAGTFKPVKTEYIGEHEMHTELIVVNRTTLKEMLDNKGKLIAVGTTSLRTIESIYFIGVKIMRGEVNSSHFFEVKQWEPYDESNKKPNAMEALQTVYAYMVSNNLDALMASTQIMIAPGYKFKFVDGLLTNFHQPQSTLLLLVSALVGERWLSIYEYALENDFRFLSYGDSSLLWKI